MAFSQVFVVNSRGETIIFRDYRGDVPKTTSEVFFREVIASKSDPPPSLNIDGINYNYVRQKGLYWVLTSVANVSPSHAAELLCSLEVLVRTQCGVSSEESLRRNAALVYELLDEAIDFGYPQSTTSDSLRACICNTPAEVGVPTLSSEKRVIDIIAAQAPSVIERLSGGSAVSTSVKSAQRPVTAPSTKKEVFVDLSERLTVTLSATGQTVAAQVDGNVTMRNFLSSVPDVFLSLNEDLVLGSTTGRSRVSGSTILDDCNFHECVNSENFERDKTISFSPPPGEIVVMRYRIDNVDHLPFHISPFVEEVSPTKIDLTIQITADMPAQKHASNVVLQCPVPKSTSNVFFQTQSGTTEFSPMQGAILWKIKRLPGESEHTLRAKLTTESPIVGAVKKEIGPITMSFDIPQWNCTNVAIRNLNVDDHTAKGPYRWIRIITTSQSYVRRL